MKETTPFEHVDYIPPKADIIHIRIQGIICQSGEAPDMNEGWRFGLIDILGDKNAVIV